jgi:hypothetical protein
MSKKRNRIHFIRSRICRFSLCGGVRAVEDLTDDKSKVTCGTCLTKLAKETKNVKTGNHVVRQPR